MEDAYKRVDMIELHDANVVVTPHHYAEGITGWTDWPSVAECWRIPGEALEHLAHHLGLETWPVDEEVRVKGEKKHYRSLLRELEIEVYREIPHSGQGHHFSAGNETQKIDWLEVKTPCIPGFLTIRMCLTWDTSDGEKETYVRELAYSGNYTVWWADESDDD